MSKGGTCSILSHIKKEKLIAVLGFVLVLIGMFTIYSAYTRADQKVIVINPGHSLGYDTGATSQFKCEAQVNQELAGRVVRLLNERGYKVYITHTTDTELASQKLLSNEEGSHLRNVGSATNSVNPDLAIALHHNSGGTTSSGYEFYWSSYRSFDSDGVYSVAGLWGTGSEAYRDSTPCPAAAASQTFAEILRQKMEGIPQLGYRKTVERDDYLPAHANCPCILYEGGYLSNPAEAAYLASDAYQVEAANRIVAAIDTYFGGSGSAPVAGTPSGDTQVPTINSVSSNVTETGDRTFTIFANASDNVGVTNVRLGTWTEADGQDDLVWTDATNNGDGNWSGTINVADHGYQGGTYITHVYAYDAAGNFAGVAGPSVVIKSMGTSSVQGLTITPVNSNIAVAYANGLGGQSYKFAVWSEADGQDDLIWGDGTPQVNGSYEYVINRADHGNAAGKYFVHCYTQDMQFVGANEVDFGRITTSTFTSRYDNGNIYIDMTGLAAPNGCQKVQFAVWSEIDGTDDVIWYDADGSGSNFSKTVNVNNHRGGGNFWIHAYLIDNYGLQQFIGGSYCATNAVINADSSNPTVNIQEVAGGLVNVSVTNVPAGYTILVPCWSEDGGQDDLVWHETAQEGSTFVVNLSGAEHPGAGLLHIHVYKRDGAGNVSFVSEHTYTLQAGSSIHVTGDTPIMGNAGVTAAQLVNFYNNNAGIAFPDYYVVRGVSLAQFAQMYIDECYVENVRADVAFAQAMHETGFLKYGGDVNISQFNFAGLGATGGGEPGENFAQKYGDNENGIRMGIRAQVQHLKAYASTDPLAQECVDARFGYVSRGRATTIAQLAGTWAADRQYAEKLVSLINKIQ